MSGKCHWEGTHRQTARSRNRLHPQRVCRDHYVQRGLREVSEGKFSWTPNLRLRIGSPVSLVVEQVEQMATDIDCPHLLIKASDSPLYMSGNCGANHQDLHE
eukprot:maker-scaffold18_size714446-snap-gene-4.14 protein:Tk08475 transcript:maker-scaffold18_size714446-snap-gene-4.14-mRNA-1 annotation:"lgi1 protein"